MLNNLSYIAENLNNANIVWGVGASVLLKHFGLVDKANDVDILVDIKDIEKVDEILKKIGGKKPAKKTDTYSTKHFYEYVVNGFDIDVMAGFCINHDEGIFEYIFDEKSISEIKKINGVDVPLTSLEDWFVLYQVMPNREPKVKLIEDYLLSNGVKHTVLLERALKGNLPAEVRFKIERMLKI